jgi:ABC-type cobalamin/Fe3+-siderophores transport system ATPase subunit
VGLSSERDRIAGLLSHGQKQWLEIGMLLIQEPKLLLLDEPVAGLSDEETERTAELLKRLAGEALGGGGRARHALRRPARLHRERAAPGQRAGRGRPGVRAE